MKKVQRMNPRERLVHHVQELEYLEEARKTATDNLKDRFGLAALDGYDLVTLKAILKLRKMTPAQRAERRALEAIYLAALGMLEGDSLPEEARRRLDRADDPPPAPATVPPADAEPAPDAPPPEMPQPPLWSDPRALTAIKGIAWPPTREIAG